MYKQTTDLPSGFLAAQGDIKRVSAVELFADH